MQMLEMKEEITGLTSLTKEQQEEINNLEQYSRRDSVRIHGLPDNGREETSWDCEQKFLKVVNITLGLPDINTHKISALHRVGRLQQGKPRPVIVKFVSRKDKEQVIKARCRLKGSGIVISEDLTHLNIQRLNRLKQQEGVVDAWSAAGGRLFAKLRDSSVVEIKSGDTSPIDRKLTELHNEQRSQHQRRSEGNPQRFPQDTLQRQHVHRPQIHQQPTHKEKAQQGLSTPPSQLSRSSHSTPTTPTSAAEAVSPQPDHQTVNEVTEVCRG